MQVKGPEIHDTKLFESLWKSSPAHLNITTEATPGRDGFCGIDMCGGYSCSVM